MEISRLVVIKAVGNLLQNYHSDLTYVVNFQRYKQSAISGEEYCLKYPGSFQAFLNDFRIARNVQRTMVRELLSVTTDWVHTDQADDVDQFANGLRTKGLTHDKTMTSLASKILFLNNPWAILPCDTLNRRAAAVKTNSYSAFRKTCHDIFNTIRPEMDSFLSPVEKYLQSIEDDFKPDIDNLNSIRLNRFLDKLLWVQGRNPRPAILSKKNHDGLRTNIVWSENSSLVTHGGHKAKRFKWIVRDNSIIIDNENGRHETYSFREIFEILKWLWGEFGRDWFPLANNVKKLGQRSEANGLAVAILRQRPRDVRHAQGASYLGVVLEQIGLLEWNAEQKGIRWRITDPVEDIHRLIRKFR